MKPFVTQLFRLALSSLAVYAVLLGISVILVPLQRGGTLDTAQSAHSLFATEPKYVFLGRGALSSEKDKVLLLGASNVVVGFKRDQLQQLVPGAEINNISVGGSNVTQLRQIVDLVFDVQSPEARRHNTFVIGVWYGLFAEDHWRWNVPNRHAGDTDIDIERYRYGFYRRTETGPVSMIPHGLLGVGVALIHPVLVVDKLLRDATKSVRRVMTGKPPTTAQHNPIVISESDRRRYLAFWDDYMGGDGRLADEQLVALTGLIGRITGAGGRVVIADLPLPAWHQNRSPYYADYRERTRGLFDRFDALPGVQVVRLRSGGTDAEFSDEVHPMPEVALGWSRQLAAVLNRQGGDGGHLLAGQVRAAGVDPRGMGSANP